MESPDSQSADKRRVMLNYPPASSVWHLPVGISQLSAILKADGHEVEQRYGHIEGIEHLLAQHGGESIGNARRIVGDPRSSIRELYSARQTFETVSRSIPTKDRFSVQRNNVLYVSEHYDGSIEGVLEAVRDRTGHLWYEYFRDVEIAQVLQFKPHLYGISVADEREFMRAWVLERGGRGA